VDRFTKRAHFIPTTTTLTAEGAARLFRDHVWKDHGWPKKIITDRGTQFAAKFAQALNTLLGIKSALSTAYHPQTDGQTERLNQELEQYLRLYTNYMQTDWYDWLSPAEFAYNNHVHSSTHFSPFFLEYGRHPFIPIHLPAPPSTSPAADEFRQQLDHTRTLAKDALSRTADTMKLYADKRRKPSPAFAKGDLVWLDATNLKTGRPSKKLDVRRTGPFEIIDVITPLAYRLKLPHSWRVHPVFHVSLLRLATINETLHPTTVDNTLRPPPDVIDGTEEYHVEAILDHDGESRRRKFLVKWFGYPTSEASWEPRSNLRHAPDIVHAYESKL
jgi:hypothetical protein